MMVIRYRQDDSYTMYTGPVPDHCTFKHLGHLTAQATCLHLFISIVQCY